VHNAGGQRLQTGRIHLRNGTRVDYNGSFVGRSGERIESLAGMADAKIRSERNALLADGFPALGGHAAP